MAVQPSSMLLPNGRLNQRLLNEDLSSIKYLYAANGFLQSNVSAEMEDNYQGKKNELQVVLKITEGPQTLVNAVQLAGANSFTPQQLDPLLSSVSGQPFSDANIATDRDAITYFYYDRGSQMCSSSLRRLRCPANRSAWTCFIRLRKGSASSSIACLSLVWTLPSLCGESPNAHSRRRSSQPDRMGSFATAAVLPGLFTRSTWRCRIPKVRNLPRISFSTFRKPSDGRPLWRRNRIRDRQHPHTQ